MKACKDCEYFEHLLYSGVRCNHPKLQKFSVIWGSYPVDARDARKPKGKCGPSGKLWTEKKSWFQRYIVEGSMR